MDKLLKKLEEVEKSLKGQRDLLLKKKDEYSDDGKSPKQKMYNEPKKGTYEERNPKPGLKPGEKSPETPKDQQKDEYRKKTLGQLTPPKSVQRRVYKGDLVKALEDAANE